MGEIPCDWNDIAAWDSYFKFRIQTEEDPNDGLPLLDPSNLLEAAEGLRNNGVSTIWIPGCGLSLLPSVLAGLGFDVFATDTSSVAIDYQLSGNFNLSNYKGLKSQVSLVAEEHDSREEYKAGDIDLIINVKAFQRFSANDMQKVAQSHYFALRGKEAIFSTLNCQGEERDVLEESLHQVGFFIPFYELERSYRAAIRDTGIPCAFVLGRPIIPQVDEEGNMIAKWDDEKWRLSSQEVLKRISQEYEKRREAEHEKELKKYHAPDTRIAEIHYDTG